MVSSWFSLHIDFVTNRMSADSQVFTGSIRVGFFTAQLGVTVTVTPEKIVLKSAGREFTIDRTHFDGLQMTAILGIFKRGVRLLHSQPGLAEKVIFYPAGGPLHFTQTIQQLGWS